MTDDAVSRPVPLDGSPKVDTILQAAWLFGVHIDPARYGLAALPPARQVTVLLAILSAHITSDQVVHAQVDTPSFHERKAYARWATADVRIGWPADEADTHIADMALWMMEWAGFLAEQLTDGRRETPISAITRLIRAARFAITFVRQQDNPTPITRNIGVPIDKLLGKARDATVSALVELEPLPAPANGDRMVPAPLFEQALQLLGHLYHSDPCTREADGDCVAHGFALDVEDTCPMKQTRAFLHEHMPPGSCQTEPVDDIVPAPVPANGT